MKTKDNPTLTDKTTDVANKNDPNTVQLDTPIKRGDGQITSVTLRKPNAGELRGVSLAELLQMKVDALQAVLPRITNPISGSIYALDPDIPIARQRMAVSVTGAVPGHRLLLDKRDIGAADAKPMLLTAPGAHRLALVDVNGRVVDQVLFTVR